MSSTTFVEKLDFTTANHIKEYKFAVDLIPNEWKHLLKTGTSQKKIPFKALYPYKGTRNVKGFQKLSNKEIYFTLQSNIIVLNNTINLSNSFHGQASLKTPYSQSRKL